MARGCHGAVEQGEQGFPSPSRQSGVLPPPRRGAFPPRRD